MMDPKTLAKRVNSYIDSCRLQQFKYSSTTGGLETLYASCFSVMLKRYIGSLELLTIKEKKDWSEYLNSWQDKHTGRFIGPEIQKCELNSPKHDWDHITMHLTAHVLPALNLLDAKPNYPLQFAHRLLNLSRLQEWLNKRDWKDAWLEGNNLLFILQFLIHLRDKENIPNATVSLELLFDWLRERVDPKTGLWGTNGYCSNFIAMCGGYHQLLAFYKEKKPIQFPERLILTTLNLQHQDGGFNPNGGGGACEDVDAVDILVNLYKYVDYKRSRIRHALRKALRNILRSHMPDGGFVYTPNQHFIHMGIKRTSSMPNQSNMFTTWFRIHSIALVSEILTDEPMSMFDWKFNKVFSMGWHPEWDKEANKILLGDRVSEMKANIVDIGRHLFMFLKGNG